MPLLVLFIYSRSALYGLFLLKHHTRISTCSFYSLPTYIEYNNRESQQAGQHKPLPLKGYTMDIIIQPSAHDIQGYESSNNKGEEQPVSQTNLR